MLIPFLVAPRVGLLVGVLVALLAACSAAPAASVPRGSVGAPPAAAEPEIIIEIFGTRQLTLDRLLATHGEELRGLVRALRTNAPDLQARTEAILPKLYALGDFAEVILSPIQHYGDAGRYFLTLDFVDSADAARRMPFAPAPTGTHPDPDGLVADWRAYEAKLNELMAAGEMKPARVACPAFHCPGDHRHPEVAELTARFVERVPARAAELAVILRDDRDWRRRAAAAFLLAYMKDGDALVKLLVPAFRDGNELVRNNAMRVVAEIAHYHVAVDVPLDPVLEALDYPATLDRNKAAAILDGLLARPGAERMHGEVVRRAGATILAMLRLRQPNNHDFAYSILKRLSGERFAARDYAAWEAWLRTQQARSASAASGG